ncbi:MAG: hypothetical protein Q7R66_08755 [Undibacterium sp.]|nr:hypothetical protein [Undibacterium sp.]
MLPASQMAAKRYGWCALACLFLKNIRRKYHRLKQANPGLCRDEVFAEIALRLYLTPYNHALPYQFNISKEKKHPAIKLGSV